MTLHFIWPLKLCMCVFLISVTTDSTMKMNRFGNAELKDVHVVFRLWTSKWKWKSCYSINCRKIYREPLNSLHNIRSDKLQVFRTWNIYQEWWKVWEAVNTCTWMRTVKWRGKKSKNKCTSAINSHLDQLFACSTHQGVTFLPFAKCIVLWP